MISSESSDEEFETLHAQQVAPQRKRNAETVAKKKQQKEAAAAEAAEAQATPATAYEVRPEMSREEKKEIRKKRKLEQREMIAKEQAAKQQKIAEQERQLKGRPYTLTIAIPGSIIDNAQTKELKTYLAGQVARAAVIFQVDEIVVFDDQLGASKDEGPNKRANDCHVFLLRILQYLETPQYLRRALFPMHSDLSCAGLLNPLDCPHHLRGTEWSVYREGVVVDRPLKEKEGSHVNVGLQREVVVDKRIQPGVRVTVKIDEATKDHKKKMMGKLVSSAEPREQLGVYWGYTARFASSLSNVWKDCPFQGGYDLKIGTSERGNVCVDDDDFKLPRHRHALVVFGGVAGIEECVNADETIPANGDEAHTLFDMWVNTCPTQGSRTIRSEEAVLVSLSALRKPLTVSGKKG
ncbi:hypothetical protein Poli38472_009792 [Pythium oligandrum]|uniref:Methyltransferase n=1 Tax=Pythium oligandrum TaxID=41045 RepID=A0A8K1CFW9_PYTOL|nr:hypothetical protein Poli38472_009792 [Pythium oligandrum]|eukprot:TMW62299.1 hypothetical protein Poli38472_009792 [Pythium oligandrum]